MKMHFEWRYNKLHKWKHILQRIEALCTIKKDNSVLQKRWSGHFITISLLLLDFHENICILKNNDAIPGSNFSCIMNCGHI